MFLPIKMGEWVTQRGLYTDRSIATLFIRGMDDGSHYHWRLHRLCGCCTIVLYNSDPIPDRSRASHNAPVPYPTIHHFVAWICAFTHIYVTNWCTVEYWDSASRDLWDGFIASRTYSKLWIYTENKMRLKTKCIQNSACKSASGEVGLLAWCPCFKTSRHNEPQERISTILLGICEMRVLCDYFEEHQPQSYGTWLHVLYA